MGFYDWKLRENEKLTKQTHRVVFGCVGMQGPFPLSRDVIMAAVGGAEAGNYRLSRHAINEPFLVDYVGRSDSQLAERIADHIGEKEYKSFVYSCQPNPELAYAQECCDFHDFGGDIGLLENDPEKGHPHSPGRMSLLCPTCGA